MIDKSFSVSPSTQQTQNSYQTIIKWWLNMIWLLHCLFLTSNVNTSNTRMLVARQAKLAPISSMLSSRYGHFWLCKNQNDLRLQNGWRHGRFTLGYSTLSASVTYSQWRSGEIRLKGFECNLNQQQQNRERSMPSFINECSPKQHAIPTREEHLRDRCSRFPSFIFTKTAKKQTNKDSHLILYINVLLRNK